MTRPFLSNVSRLTTALLMSTVAALAGCDDDGAEAPGASAGRAGAPADTAGAGGTGGTGGGAGRAGGPAAGQGGAGSPGDDGGRGGAGGQGGAARPTFVLVHGAWSGAWVWADVIAGLRAGGAEAVAVELPAHGADTTPIAGATLDAYEQKVSAAVAQAAPPVVLVAHSMAGVVATQAAERGPDRIAKLVYLAAYLPKDGETLQALAAQDADSHIGPVIGVDVDAGTASLPLEGLGDIFCADCPAPALAALEANYRDEPLAPFGAPVRVTEQNWGRVPRYYFYTANDHAVSPALQQAMTAGVPFVSTLTLDTGHTPSLSRPGLVVSALLGL